MVIWIFPLLCLFRDTENWVISKVSSEQDLNEIGNAFSQIETVEKRMLHKFKFLIFAFGT